MLSTVSDAEVSCVTVMFENDHRIVIGTRDRTAGPHRRVVPVAAHVGGPGDCRQQGSRLKLAHRRPENTMEHGGRGE